MEIFAFSIYVFGAFFLWGTIGCLFSIFIDWFQKRDKILMLEKQNAESNLALLRTQINPHFLFNTLHNIDALIMDNQEKASKALIKLSDIMRYMLQESPLNHVSLKKELDYIENYISLERLRIKNPDFIKFAINGDYEGINVAPMLFLPFIENAFKHSVDSDCENGVTILFNINKNIITFSCDNKYDKIDSERDKTHGIGLETVKKRLELIYPGKHNLRISKNNSLFKVELKIEVNDN
jgi:LytS/YehU family sensor histidine kinase